MAINFRVLPDRNRVPGVYVEMDPSGEYRHGAAKYPIDRSEASRRARLPDLPVLVESAARLSP